MKTALAVVKGDFLDLPEEYSELVKDKPEIFAKSQLLNKITGRLKARYDEAQDKGLAFNGQEIANELLEQLGGDFNEAIKKMTIRSGEDVVRVLNQFLKDGQKIEIDDFDSAINILRRLKENKKERPAGLRSMKDPDFFKKIDSLQKAKETANTR